jgi:thiamine biosynthesis protein ThiS
VSESAITDEGNRSISLGSFVYIVVMVLHINGAQKEVADGLSLAALVEELGMKPDRVAVELNREIVARAQWGETLLRGGDEVEIVHFVGGG